MIIHLDADRFLLNIVFQVRYISDCEELYGKVLDNYNVVSSVQGFDKRETQEIWNELYPNESYEFDMSRALSSEVSETVYGTQTFSKYDFVLAIERQKGFFYQVILKPIKLQTSFPLLICL